MAISEEEFERAVSESKQLSTRPDSSTLLRLYAFYKQASEGDSRGERPPMTDFVGRTKYDAWAELDGLDRAQARAGYVELIESLK